MRDHRRNQASAQNVNHSENEAINNGNDDSLKSLDVMSRSESNAPQHETCCGAPQVGSKPVQNEGALQFLFNSSREYGRKNK